MRNFTTYIMKKIKEANLLAPQGGPIILAQVNVYVQLFSRPKLICLACRLTIHFGQLVRKNSEILLQQIENEYGNVEWAYGEAGKRYVKWVVQLAKSLNIGVPWIMCQQGDAPLPIVSIMLIIFIHFCKKKKINSLF